MTHCDSLIRLLLLVIESLLVSHRADHDLGSIGGLRVSGLRRNVLHLSTESTLWMLTSERCFNFSDHLVGFPIDLDNLAVAAA